MKKLYQIGMLILFMIGLCFVQLDFSKTTLVDDDVGAECIIGNLNNAILMEPIAMPDKIASPLKYSIVIAGQEVTGNKNQEIWYELKNDCNVHYSVSGAICIVTQQVEITEISSTNLLETKLQESVTDIHTSEYTSSITGRYRLNIGDNYSKTIIC